MEAKDLPGFNRGGLPEKSREALGPDARHGEKAAMAGIRHFTAEKQSAESAYGYTWHQAVNEYLKTGYRDGAGQHGITVLGEAYKVMRGEEVTAFCNADGDTLFDVENKRLEKEYEWLMGQPEATARQGTAGGTKEQAKKKLEKELREAKDRPFAEPVIEYLLKRCEEDGGLALDVVQGHKTWEKCYGYIYSEARKSAQKGARSCAVRDDVVYEWAEDYYHKDDKAEEEAKARKAAGAKKKAKEKEAKKKEKSSAAGKEKPEVLPAVAKKDNQKPKKSSNGMEGQLDMFSMMGM